MPDVQRAAPSAADDLGRDDAIEPEVLELEDLAHAARADPLDRLEAVEDGAGSGRARAPPA